VHSAQTSGNNPSRRSQDWKKARMVSIFLGGPGKERKDELHKQRDKLSSLLLIKAPGSLGGNMLARGLGRQMSR